MTPRRSDHGPIRMLPEFVCEAIPAVSLPQAKDGGSDKNGEESPKPHLEDEGSEAGDIRPEPPADSEGREKAT